MGWLLIALLIHFALGTGVRIHVDDISKELNYQMRELWLNKTNAPAVFFIHGFFSWFILIASVYMVWLLRKIRTLRKPVAIYLAFVLLNMLAGAVLSKLNIPALAQPLHLLLACAAISQWFYLLLITRKSETDHYS